MLLVLQTPTVFLITSRLLTLHDTDMYAVLAQSAPDLDSQRREREQNEATVNGIVIALGCHGERMFIVGKLDCGYEKLWKHLIFLPRVTHSLALRLLHGAVSQICDGQLAKGGGQL